jgi:C4-dicarboxylate-specific signal transduction histidine kinase
LYRTLSTAGITAAVFAHESAGNPIKVITNAIRTIERRAMDALGTKYGELLKKPVDSIARAIGSLSVLGTATLRLLRQEKRRAARVDVHAVIDNTLETLSPFLVGRQIAVTKTFTNGSPYLRATEAAVESIITNLLNNSIAAVEQSHRRRQISVQTELNNGNVLIRVADSGPGIDGIALRDIWLPGETTKPNGTGLGLTIVRDATRDIGGDVDAVEHGELGGAEFTVSLPILGH